MSTQPHGKHSVAICRDTIRDGLRSAAGDESPLLDDPEAPRSDGSQFVLTSFPDRNVQYPHIVVQEVGDDADRRDSRVNLQMHDYSVRVELYARTATELFNLRAGVKEWFADNVATLRDAGFVDVSTSASSMNYEGNTSIDAAQVTATGDLYTA